MTESTNKSLTCSRRDTPRKRRLREVLYGMYSGQAVLLDELRWTVMGPQFTEEISENSRRTILNSFARTVREQLAEHVIKSVRISPSTPIGLVARAAVYRLKDVRSLRRFLNAEGACILCRYKTNFDADEPRYEPPTRYVRPQYHAVTFRFFEYRPSDISYGEIDTYPGVFIPKTQKLTLVVPRGATADLNKLATVPWTLYGYYDLSDWFEVAGTDSLLSVQRNRRF